MFHRGQKIIITESNVIGKMHPAVGDMGYIENMFLFPNDRFILMSLIMCSYKKGGPRSEHKKFILDLGMNKPTLCKISRGVNRLFFLSRKHINLLPAFLQRRKVKDTNNDTIADSILSTPQIVGTYGIWTGYTSTNMKRSRLTDTKVAIPYGNIKGCDCKSSVDNLPIQEIKSWLRAILPNISAVCLYLKWYVNQNVNGLTKEVSLALGCLLPIIDTRIQHDEIDLYKIKMEVLTDLINIHKSTNFLTEPVLKLNSLSYTALNRAFRCHIPDILSATKKKVISNYAIDQLSKRYAPNITLKLERTDTVGEMIELIIYLSLFINKPTKPSLEYISDFLPKQWNIDKISKEADEIKSDIKSGSAALNRIFGIIDPLCTSSASIADELPNINIEPIEERRYRISSKNHTQYRSDIKKRLSRLGIFKDNKQIRYKCFHN